MGADTVLVGPDISTKVESVAVDPSEAAAVQAKLASVRESRAAKIAAASATLSKALDSDAGASAVPPPAIPAADAPVPAAKLTDDETPPDEKTARALELIEKRAARERAKLAEEQKAWRSQHDTERTNLEKLRAELEKSKPTDDLKKLPAQRRYVEALRLAGIDPDDDEMMEVVARDAYARSKSGKADPKNRAYADQVAEKTSLQSELAELRKMVEETRSDLTGRDAKAQQEQFVNQYIDGVIKAMPTEPSMVARTHAANPGRARAELLSIGQHLERELGETPTHEEVIEAYEKHLRQDLTDRGMTAADIQALLVPSAAKPAATAPIAKPARTLDPAAGSPTKPLNANPSRAEKLAMAGAELRKRRMES